MRKLMTGILVLALVGFGLYGVVASMRQSAARERIQQAEEDKRRMDLAAFTAKYDVVTDWQEQLVATKSPFAQVLTSELEPYWLSGRPILFKGSLLDVASVDDQHYEVLFKQTMLSKVSGLMGNNLGLRLRAEKGPIDALLRAEPDIMAPINVVATIYVIAKVDSITTEAILEAGEMRQYKVGRGSMVDLHFSRLLP